MQKKVNGKVKKLIAFWIFFPAFFLDNSLMQKIKVRDTGIYKL